MTQQELQNLIPWMKRSLTLSDSAAALVVSSILMFETREKLTTTLVRSTAGMCAPVSALCHACPGGGGRRWSMCRTKAAQLASNQITLTQNVGFLQWYRLIESKEKRKPSLWHLGITDRNSLHASTVMRKDQFILNTLVTPYTFKSLAETVA